MITAKGTKWAGEFLTVSDLMRLDLLTIFFTTAFITSVGLLLMVFRALPSMYYEVLQYFRNG